MRKTISDDDCFNQTFQGTDMKRVGDIGITSPSHNATYQKFVHLCILGLRPLIDNLDFHISSLRSLHLTLLRSTSAISNGRRRPQIPAPEPQILAPAVPPPQPRYLPHHPRIHPHDLAQSERGPASRRETHHTGQEEHQRQQAASREHILRALAYTLIPAPSQIHQRKQYQIW